MAINYRLRQDNREVSRMRGWWFAHAVNHETVETEALARMIERNCSVKRSDVLAVLAELSEVMRDMLLDSRRVRLDGIGSFMVGLSGKGAPTPEDFRKDVNIRSAHINFIPEKSNRKGVRKNTLLDGWKVGEQV